MAGFGKQFCISVMSLLLPLILLSGCDQKNSSNASQQVLRTDPNTSSPVPSPGVPPPAPPPGSSKEPDLFSYTPGRFNAILENPPLDSDQMVVNAADFRAPVAPGSIASLFGSDFSNKTAIASEPLPYHFENIIIQIGTAYGLIFFVSPKQVNFLVPETLRAGNYPLVVLKNGSEFMRTQIEVSAVSPALFTANNSGVGAPKGFAYQRANFLPLFDTTSLLPQPIDAGTKDTPNFLILFGTGFRNRSSLAKVTAKIGVHASEVMYAGPQGIQSGLDQINVRIPPEAITDRSQNFSLRLSVDGILTNWTTICIHGKNATAGPCGSLVPSRLTAVFGTGQVSAHPYAFRDSLTVRVEDASGAPVEKTALEWFTHSPNRVAWFPFTSTMTNANGISSNEAKTLQNLDFPGVGTEWVGVRVSGTTSSQLSTSFLLTAMTLPFFGQVDPLITYNHLPEEISVAAGATLRSAFSISFTYPLGPAQSKPIEGAGVRVSTSRTTLTSPSLSAICVGGSDESGTVLSNPNGLVTCDLKVGETRGRALLKIRMFGGFDRLVNLNVY